MLEIGYTFRCTCGDEDCQRVGIIAAIEDKYVTDAMVIGGTRWTTCRYEFSEEYLMEPYDWPDEVSASYAEAGLLDTIERS